MSTAPSSPLRAKLDAAVAKYTAALDAAKREYGNAVDLAESGLVATRAALLEEAFAALDASATTTPAAEPTPAPRTRTAKQPPPALLQPSPTTVPTNGATDDGGIF